MIYGLPDVIWTKDKINIFKGPNPFLYDPVSYQPTLVQIYLGFLHAKNSFWKTIKNLENSEKKEEYLEKIGEYTKRNMDNILVQFFGFHKLASKEVRDKIGPTIISSSPLAIEDFKIYLENGWNLQIIPRIVYDKYLDVLKEVQFSYYIEKYYDKVLQEYKGKGRIIVRSL